MIRGSLMALLVFVISCGGKDKLPEDVLPPQKMQEVLWDLTRADQYSLTLAQNDTTKSVEFHNKAMYQHVFAIHKIDYNTFRRSYDYYSSNPDKFKIMFDSLQAQKTRFVEQSLLADTINKQPVGNPVKIEP
jgi:hypothetical protein